MKKAGFLLLSIAVMFTIFAQSGMKIYKSDSTILGIGISTIDSMKISDDNLKLFNSSKSIDSLKVSSIDSILFGDDFPVLRTIEASLITQSTAKVGLIIKSKGGSGISKKGVCWSSFPNPTVDSSNVISYSTIDSSVVYMTGLTGGNTYYARAFAKNASITTYGQLISLMTLDYTLPEVETTSITSTVNIQALCVGKVISSGGYSVLTVRGFCWSTSDNPTLNDNRVPFGVTNGSYQTYIKFPAANVKYYVRAYATNPLGTTYGSVIAVTPQMGNVTYNLNQGSNPTATEKEYFRLIKIAMDSACYYYNKYTTFSANIYVYYSSGIPTAQASFKGSIGFGPSTTYMHVCTAMHEMAHYMGSGTTTVWQNLTVNGIYTGASASKVLKDLNGEVLKGDDMHFWPYGLNYRSEVKSAEDYVRHAKIVEAMRKDCNW